MDKLYLTVFSVMEEPSLSVASEERSQWILFGFFSAASILDGCGDVGYLLIVRLEKRQMQGARRREDEN
jgi:hypothetical protein